MQNFALGRLLTWNLPDIRVTNSSIGLKTLEKENMDSVKYSLNIFRLQILFLEEDLGAKSAENFQTFYGKGQKSFPGAKLKPYSRTLVVNSLHVPALFFICTTLIPSPGETNSTSRFTFFDIHQGTIGNEMIASI